MGSVVNPPNLRRRRCCFIQVLTDAEWFAPSPVAQTFDAKPDLEGGFVRTPSVHVSFQRSDQHIFLCSCLAKPNGFLSVVAYQEVSQRMHRFRNFYLILIAVSSFASQNIVPDGECR